MSYGPAPTPIPPLSLHDALPISFLRDEHGRRFMLEVHPAGELAPRDVVARGIAGAMARQGGRPVLLDATGLERDRKSTRLNSSHVKISDAVFCLKKKRKNIHLRV